MSDYNGYSNRATWNVCLWLGNDEGTYFAARDYANERKAKGGVKPGGARAFAQQVFPDGRTPDGCKLSAVSWKEVADCINEFAAD